MDEREQAMIMTNDRIPKLENDLSRIISFNENCDNKSSIVMGGVLAISALIVGLNGSSFSDYYRNNDISVPGAIVFVLLVISMISIIVGLSFIICSLFARMGIGDHDNADSLIFYGSIASKGCDGYRESVSSRTDDDYVSDLMDQIYINSVICTRKYRMYNTGLSFSVSGTILLFICSIVRFFF